MWCLFRTHSNDFFLFSWGITKSKNYGTTGSTVFLTTDSARAEFPGIHVPEQRCTYMKTCNLRTLHSQVHVRLRDPHIANETTR